MKNYGIRPTNLLKKQKQIFFSYIKTDEFTS